jgi:hypothetical protein
VIVAIPAATPVTSPVEAFTVATPAAELDQLPPVTVEVKIVDEPAQIACGPLSVPAVAGAVTAMLPLAVPVPPVQPVKVTV